MGTEPNADHSRRFASVYSARRRQRTRVRSACAESRLRMIGKCFDARSVSLPPSVPPGTAPPPPLPNAYAREPPAPKPME